MYQFHKFSLWITYLKTLQFAQGLEIIRHFHFIKLSKTEIFSNFYAENYFYLHSTESTHIANPATLLHNSKTNFERKKFYTLIIHFSYPLFITIENYSILANELTFYKALGRKGVCTKTNSQIFFPSKRSTQHSWYFSSYRDTHLKTQNCPNGF